MLVRSLGFEDRLSIVAPCETDLDKFKASHDINVFLPLLLAQTMLRLLKRSAVDRIAGPQHTSFSSAPIAHCEILTTSRRPGLHELLRIENQTSHATQVKEHALASIYKTKDYVLTNGAPSHEAGTSHV